MISEKRVSSQLQDIAADLAEIAANPPAEADSRFLAKAASNLLALAAHVYLGEQIDPSRVPNVQVPSNQATEMLERLRCAGETGADLSPGDPVCAWAYSEIERLQRLLADQLQTSRDDALIAFKANRERDAAIQAIAREGRHARRIENERLRAALERIERGDVGDCPVIAMFRTLQAIAREALAGSAAEPGAQPDTRSAGHSIRAELAKPADGTGWIVSNVRSGRTHHFSTLDGWEVHEVVRPAAEPLPLPSDGPTGKSEA